MIVMTLDRVTVNLRTSLVTPNPVNISRAGWLLRTTAQGMLARRLKFTPNSTGYWTRYRADHHDRQVDVLAHHANIGHQAVLYG